MDLLEVQQRLGWISEDLMTDEQKAFHRATVAAMPMFSVVPKGTPPVGTKIMLTDLWKHDRTVKTLGRIFRGWGQFSGSCVGVGGGNACQTKNLVDAILLDEPEKIVSIAWYFNYGLSRLRGGMRGQGEGSFGSSFAKSLELDGTIDSRHEGLDDKLPEGTEQNSMWVIGKSGELKWSDGAFPSTDIKQAAKPQAFKTSPLKSFEQVRDSILAGRPVTRAGMSFVNPNTATVKSGALVGRYNGRGAHQESWLNYWNHPQLGEMIWEQNQWFDCYGQDPGGGPTGGTWITADEIDRFCQAQYAEVYSLDTYDGYEDLTEKVFDWSKQSYWS
jgi:hypothetical protein